MELHEHFSEDELEAAEYYTVCSDKQLLERLDYYELIFTDEQLELLDALREESQAYDRDHKQMCYGEA